MAKSAKTSYTATTLATECGADNPKQFRSFLRSDKSGIESVGKGSRYSFELTPTQVGALKKKFRSWADDLAAARADRKAALEDAAAKKLNVLTIAVESAPVENDGEPCPAEELDFENMTDEAIEEALNEISRGHQVEIDEIENEA